MPRTKPGVVSHSLVSNHRLRVAAAFLAGSFVLAMPFFLSASDRHVKDKDKKKAASTTAALRGLPTADLTQDEAIAHALNRLGYGPRPGDIERVKQMGLAKWIDQQLHPESIDDAALDARLARFPTLGMTSAQLEDKFPQPKREAQREGVSLQQYQKQQQASTQAILKATGGEDSQGDNSMPAISGGANDGAASPVADNRRDAKREGIPASNMMNYEEIRTPQRVVAELGMAKVDRAIYSERQLYEQMVDFWFNHFNVFAGKGADKWLLTSYERDAIRPNAMGKFRDLLEATAKSPAMLFYLDNWQSVDPDAWAALQEQQQLRRGFRYFGAGPLQGMPANSNAVPNAKKQERGLNENYGRELMELHTLGVDGGYTQDDVIAVARAFTGWTIRQPQRDPEFFFNDRLHDNKPKIV